MSEGEKMGIRYGSWHAAGLLAFLASIYCAFATGNTNDSADPPRSPAITIGDTASDWSLVTPAGKTVSFYEDSGARPSVLIFWATWCPACRKVMPELAKLQSSLPEGSANFYALNVKEDGDPVAYFSEQNYGFELLLNADDVAKDYGMFGTPRILVVDGNKVVRYTRRKGTSLEQTLVDVREALEHSGT